MSTRNPLSSAGDALLGVHVGRIGAGLLVLSIACAARGQSAEPQSTRQGNPAAVSKFVEPLQQHLDAVLRIERELETCGAAGNVERSVLKAHGEALLREAEGLSETAQAFLNADTRHGLMVEFQLLGDGRAALRRSQG